MTTLWHDRAFLRYWTASAISDVGSQVTALALPLIGALTLNATAWQMGALTAASTAPILVLGLFAGVIVDRLRRRPVLIAADIGRAVLLAVIPLAAWLGMLSIELLIAVAFLTGALSMLFDIAHRRSCRRSSVVRISWKATRSSKSPRPARRSSAPASAAR
jgi:MFS family permease